MVPFVGAGASTIFGTAINTPGPRSSPGGRHDAAAAHTEIGHRPHRAANGLTGHLRSPRRGRLAPRGADALVGHEPRARRFDYEESASRRSLSVATRLRYSARASAANTRTALPVVIDDACVKPGSCRIERSVLRSFQLDLTIGIAMAEGWRSITRLLSGQLCRT